MSGIVEAERDGRAQRPWQVTAATTAAVAVPVGLTLWIILTFADVMRLNREAATLMDRFDGSEGPTVYALFSFVCTVILIVVGVLVTAAAVWLIRRGRRASLALTCVLLAAAVVLLGLPSSLVAAVLAFTGRAHREVTAEMSFDDALTAVHTANQPGWVVPVAVTGSILIVAGGLAAITLLLLRRSRRYFAER